MSVMCEAKARRKDYQPCNQPAMENGRCRLHGGLSTGPKTKAGLLKIKRANTKHGFYSAKAILERKIASKLIKYIKNQN
jgi:hypothetical protein